MSRLRQDPEVAPEKFFNRLDGCGNLADSLLLKRQGGYYWLSDRGAKGSANPFHQQPVIPLNDCRHLAHRIGPLTDLEASDWAATVRNSSGVDRRPRLFRTHPQPVDLSARHTSYRVSLQERRRRRDRLCRPEELHLELRSQVRGTRGSPGGVRRSQHWRGLHSVQETREGRSGGSRVSPENDHHIR